MFCSWGGYICCLIHLGYQWWFAFKDCRSTANQIVCLNSRYLCIRDSSLNLVRWRWRWSARRSLKVNTNQWHICECFGSNPKSLNQGVYLSGFEKCRPKVQQKVCKSVPKIFCKSGPKDFQKCTKNVCKSAPKMFAKVRQSTAKVHQKCLQMCTKNVWKSAKKELFGKVHQKCLQKCAKIFCKSAPKYLKIEKLEFFWIYFLL